MSKLCTYDALKSVYFAFIHLHSSIWYNFEYINIYNEFDFVLIAKRIAWQISTLT